MIDRNKIKERRKREKQKKAESNERLIREGVTVNNIGDLKQALAPFMADRPDTDITVETSSEGMSLSNDASITKHGTIKASLESNDKRKLLLKGIEMLERQQKAELTTPTDVDEQDYGGYKPASMSFGANYSWVDTLISRCLDGRRRPDNTIEWVLSDGIYVFDPKTSKLTKEDGNS